MAWFSHILVLFRDGERSEVGVLVIQKEAPSFHNGGHDAILLLEVLKESHEVFQGAEVSVLQDLRTQEIPEHLFDRVCLE